MGETIRAVLPLVEQKTDRTFLDRMLRRHAEILESVVAAYTRNVERHVPIHPEYVAAALDELADDDAVFTVDTGMCNVWAARYLTPNGRRRVIGSWRHGTMANALPQAIGAQLAFPGRQVVSMSGDGGLAMLLGELLTVRLHDLPLKIALFNNASLGHGQARDAGRRHAGLRDRSRAGRLLGDRAARSGSTRSASRTRRTCATPWRTRSARKGPVLMEFVTDPNALSMPPSITAEQIKGFALAASKIVLDGGVGKMIELARSNLRNIPRP